MTGDRPRGRVRRREGGVAVRRIGLDHRDHLGRVAAKRGLADPVAGAQNRYRLAVRRQRGAVVDVMHAPQRRVHARIDLENDAVGLIEPGLVVTDGGGGHQAAVGQDCCNLHQRHIQMPEKAEPDELRDMAEVDIDIFHGPAVDALARDRIGLVGQAQFDAVDLGERAVQFGRGRGPRPHPDPERLAAGLRGFDPVRQRQRNGLWIARSGEAAHAHIGAMGHQRCGIVGRHDLGAKCGRHDPRMIDRHENPCRGETALHSIHGPADRTSQR